MRGVVLTTKFWRKQIGGVGEYTQQLITQMQKMGDTITIVTQPVPGDKKFYEQAQYTVLRRDMPVNQLSFIKQILNLSFFKTLKEIKDIKPDYLLCNRWYEYIGLLTFAYSKILSIPYFAFAFGTDINKILQGRSWLSTKLCKLFFLNATKVYCISRYTKSLAIKLGVSPSRISIVPVGIDRDQIRQNLSNNTNIDPRIKSLKKRLENNVIISTVCRLEPYKGIDKVIMSLPQVLKKVPNLIYLVVGYGPDLGRIKKLAKKYQVEDKVFFTGYISETDKYVIYQLSDVFVMVSRESKSGSVEGFGIVYLEAAFFKNPCIASKSNGSSDAVENGVTGILIDPSSESQIVGAIIKLAKDRKLRTQMGRAGHVRSKQFTWEKAASILKDNIENILHGTDKNSHSLPNKIANGLKTSI